MRQYCRCVDRLSESGRTGNRPFARRARRMETARRARTSAVYRCRSWNRDDLRCYHFGWHVFRRRDRARFGTGKAEALASTAQAAAFHPIELTFPCNYHWALDHRKYAIGNSLRRTFTDGRICQTIRPVCVPERIADRVCNRRAFPTPRRPHRCRFLVRPRPCTHRNSYRCGTRSCYYSVVGCSILRTCGRRNISKLKKLIIILCALEINNTKYSFDARARQSIRRFVRSESLIVRGTAHRAGRGKDESNDHRARRKRRRC